MTKKLLPLSSLLPALLILGMTALSFADVSDQLKQADKYRKNKQYEQAEKLCQDIVRAHTGTDYALRAQKKLVILYILMERQADAQAALDKLIADFTAHPDLPMHLYPVARRYENAGNQDKAKSIQEFTGQRWPNSVYAKAPLHIPEAEILSYIKRKRYRKAEMAIDELLADYSGHAYLPGTLFEIAGRYKQAHKYTAAKNIYDEIIRRYPEHWRAGKARFRLRQMDILLLVDSPDAGATHAAIDKLIADFPGQSEVPSLLYQVARKLKAKKEYGQTTDVYRLITQHYPQSPYAEKAQLGIPRMQILSLVHSPDDAAVPAGIEKLLTDFSEHENIAKTVNLIAYNYRRLKKYEKAKQIYQHVIDTWPTNDHAIPAKKGVILCNLALGDDAGAQAGIEELLSADGAHKELAEAINKIAGRYRRSDEYEKASHAYQHVVNNWPLSNETLSAQRNIVLCRIDLGDDAGAQAGVEKLLADFADHPENSKAVNNIAYRYRKLEKYDNAIEVYQRFLRKLPDDDYAMNAQVGIVMCRIALGDDAGAQTGIEELLTNFSWHRDIVKGVDRISKRYRRLENYEKADQLYQYVLETWPDPAGGLWAQTQSAISHIRAANIEDANKAVAKLISDYSDSSEIGKCLNQIGTSYLGANEYTRALELHEHVIANCPAWQRQTAMWARQGLAVCHIWLGNDEQPAAQVDKLIADYKDLWNVGSPVFVIGEAYYNKAWAYEKQGSDAEARRDFEKAMAVWNRIITELPVSSPYTQHAWYFTGVCYRRHLRDYAKTLEYYQKVVDEWPNYEYAWSAQSLIGQCYEKLRDSGVLSESEANPKIEEAYKAVIERYLDRPLGDQAFLKLASMNLQKGQWVDAAMYFELFREQYPDDKRQTRVLYQLGHAYDQMGAPDLAAEAYSAFLQSADEDHACVRGLKARLEELKGVKK